MIVSRFVRIQTPLVTVLMAAIVAAAPPALAQRGANQPEKPKNLKVLPKDTSPEKLHLVMEGFAGALGVRCSHCHAPEAADPHRLDFASDANPNKNVARGMLRMEADVERDLSRIKFQEPKRVNFGCVTCHHGLARPMTLAGALHATYESNGIDSTLAAYRALRGRYYGSGAYDFGAASLNDLGSALLLENKADDAVTIFKLNVDQNPGESDALVGLGDGYRKAGQKDLAVESYKKALELEPRNRDAAERLRDISGDGK